ncbi:hypothetical protein [Pseudomonas sp. RC10]|uniref:hypothetical protein n=1 Tax=Pseudomonas bambusae TaxID=3139142 RepID=UPI0031387767
MSVLTVFFCGTGSNSFDPFNKSYWDGELVSTLASNMNNREFADWIIIDGPGSGNLQADNLFTEPGGYGMTGTLFGKGWEENVGHALAMIKGKTDWQRTKLTKEEYDRLKKSNIPIEDLDRTGCWMWRNFDYGDRKVTPQQLQEKIIQIFRKKDEKGRPIPKQVNLVGWSRGGISCHMLANAMLADPELKHIAVNIFAIDPVPGALNFQAHRVTLGANVKQYIGFYARDERSKGFACVAPRTAPGTQVHIFPMAGRHATLVGNAADDGANGRNAFTEPGLIIRHYAEQSLTRWGATLNKMLKLTSARIDEYLKVIARNDKSFIGMRSKSYTAITEADAGERRVSWGDKGVKFSAVNGNAFFPNAGLSAPVAPTSSFHKPIV